MSFSHTAKSEICRAMTDSKRRFACLYGIFMFCKYFGEKEIKFRTGCPASSELFESLMKEFFSKEFEVAFDMQKNGEKVSYTHTISDTNAVLEKFNIDHKRDKLNIDLATKNGLDAFFSGVFLACGSVSNPKKEYHFEFAVYNDALKSELLAMTENFCGVSLRESSRRKLNVLYAKDSESVEELLTMVGATKSAMDVMLIKIDKNDNNYVNRITNCDSANIDKIVSASQKQTDAINKIIKHGALDTLSSDLREIALLRIDNPEMSLRELGEALEKPIGRSGVNHRMNRLIEIAKNLE